MALVHTHTLGVGLGPFQHRPHGFHGVPPTLRSSAFLAHLLLGLDHPLQELRLERPDALGYARDNYKGNSMNNEQLVYFVSLQTQIRIPDSKQQHRSTQPSCKDLGDARIEVLVGTHFIYMRTFHVFVEPTKGQINTHVPRDIEGVTAVS